MADKSGFEEVLWAAKAGNEDAMMEIFRMYQPLLIKNAMVRNVFDDDLYQELCVVLMYCIRVFKI